MPSLWVDRGGRARLGREIHVLTNAFQWNRNKSREVLTTYIFLCERQFYMISQYSVNEKKNND